MSDKDIKYIADQVGENITNEEIINALTLHNNDVGKVISYLWNPDIFNVKPQKEKTKIEECREICDAYDEEIQKYIQNVKNKST
jgi:transcription initiation factor IIE alpha subunit